MILAAIITFFVVEVWPYPPCHLTEIPKVRYDQHRIHEEPDTRPALWLYDPR